MLHQSQVDSLSLVLGITGSVLDFYSGYQISHSDMMLPGMGMTHAEYNPTSLAWGIGILVLGSAVLATTILGATSFGRQRMRLFGSLMVSYGVLMLLVGVSMYAGMTPIMQGASLSGLAMLVVGVLMTLSGGLMVLPWVGKVSSGSRSQMGLSLDRNTLHTCNRQFSDATIRHLTESARCSFLRFMPGLARIGFARQTARVRATQSLWTSTLL